MANGFQDKKVQRSAKATGSGRTGRHGCAGLGSPLRIMIKYSVKSTGKVVGADPGLPLAIPPGQPAPGQTAARAARSSRLPQMIFSIIILTYDFFDKYLSNLHFYFYIFLKQTKKYPCGFTTARVLVFHLVETRRIELLTSCMPCKRSPS
jgi:hypothetical protein